MSEVQSKTCTKCGADKPLTEFSKGQHTYGRHRWCRACDAVNSKERIAAARAVAQDGSKVCSGCKLPKDIDEFALGNGKFGRTSRCRTCVADTSAANKLGRTAERSAAIRANTARYKVEKKEWIAASKRRGTTGFTQKCFEVAIQIQNNECAICGEGFSELKTSEVHADHDHITGEKRGILCSKCNHALGLFNDSTVLLRRAAEYLENPPLRGVL